MSRLTVFLCLALFASAANASYWSDAFENIQNKVEATINAAITKVQEQFEAAKQKAIDTTAKLEAAAIAFSEKIVENIKQVLEDVEKRIKEATGRADGIDVTECTKFIEELDVTALAVVSNVSMCVVDKLETGSGYVETIIRISENVYDNLTLIKEEAQHCGDNIDGLTSAARAILCANVAGAKATWVATKSVPSLTVNLAKLTYLLGTLEISLARCTTTNGLIAFYRESAEIVDKAEKCVQRKIDEANSTAATPVYTTEHVYTTQQTQTTQQPKITEKLQTTEQNRLE